MRLLIFTQKIDSKDPVLGFFHSWIKELSTRAESVEVVCLEKGAYNLPKNVTVYSLGKEQGISFFGYVKNLYQYLFLVSGSYDKIFVHMNEEYVLLAGLYWRLKGIPIYLWRNHPKGNIFTRLSVLLSTKVFCTSTESYTARFSKTVVMPVGIDTKIFKSLEGIVRKKYSVCMVGRLSPVKHIEHALEAINIMKSRGVQVSLSIVGPTLDRDLEYKESLKKYIESNNLGTLISFFEAVTQNKLPEIYSSYEICLNLTEAGSFDKTIAESAACGAIPLVSDKSFGYILPEVCITSVFPSEIALSIQRLFDPHEQIKIQNDLKSFAENQSLSALIQKLYTEIQ